MTVNGYNPGSAGVSPAIASQVTVGIALPVDMGLDLKATIFGCTQGKSVVTAYGPKNATFYLALPVFRDSYIL